MSTSFAENLTSTATICMVELYSSSMRADRLFAENILGLLRLHGQKQSDLAQWCRHSDVWLSNILKTKREVQIRDLDRIADFFGLATYQLFQPGVSERTERRGGIDRRRQKERRISHETKLARDLEERLRPTSRRRAHGKEAAVPEQIRAVFRDVERQFSRLLSQAESRGQAPKARRAQSRPSPRARITDGSDPEDAGN
jgi:transcriptional regulator with XRE-family HTH domain